jgi:cell wall-associated NlpC family hydrolase
MEAVVKTETLKVREGADYESDVITMIPHDEAYEVVSVDGDWVLLAVDYDVQGYVNKQYVELRYSVGRALSVEEQELAAAARAEAEEARLHQTPQEEGYQDVYQDNTDYGTNETNNNETYDNNNTYDNNDTYDNSETNNNDTNNNDTDNNDTYETPQETYETPQETYDTPQETYEEPEPETPVEEPSYDAPSGAGGDALAAYALQFVGNPYVWGGTSLTNGADCSGFVLSIYAQWGIYLPHDAELQANYGTEVSLSALMPGDLLFYSSGGYAIGHVAIYIGGGQVVHASSPSTGIKVSVYNYRTPCKAVRLLP